MSDPSDPFTEGAKAVQEVAKTTRAAIEAGSELGKFAAKMFGTVPEDLVGITFGNYLRVKRMENAERIFRKAEARLAARGVEESEAIDLKHIQPLLEAVSEESDETLQDMWANLIANAMDPNHTAHFQKIFIETLRQFESIDALVLHTIRGTDQITNLIGFKQIVEGTSGRPSLVEVALKRMLGLDCVWAHESMEKHLQNRAYAISALGKELHMACQPNG